MNPMGIAVLVSGSGTILEAMLRLGLPISLVVSDRPCLALERASEHGIEAMLVDRRSYGGFGEGFDRDGYSRELAVAILGREPSLIAMAGFGTVVAKAFHEAFPGRILNTHPALLPAFPGWHGVEDALAAGVPVTGCTVHIAGLEVDSGPILAQGKVEVRADDTVESLHERIKEVERRLYPETIAKVLEAIAVGAEPASLAGEQVA